MGRRSSLGWAALLLVVVPACGAPASISAPGGRASVVAALTGTDITRVDCVITASDMSPLTVSLTLANGEARGVIAQIPAGPARTFTLNAYAGAALVCTGSAQADVGAGAVVAVSITALCTSTPAVTLAPRLDLGRPTYASGGVASTCNDQEYGQDYWGLGTQNDNRWLPTAPAWCAIDLGATGASKILVSLSDEMSGNIAGSPGFKSYVLEVSADSTNGSDGTWTQALQVTGNAYLFREHTIPFANERWLRVKVTAPASISLDDVDVWDVSTAPVGSIVWVGDSITARCDQRAGSYGADPSLRDVLVASNPAHDLLQLGAGTVGIAVDGELSGNPSNLATYLSLFPDVTYWGIALGTNDSAGGTSDAAFHSGLQSMVDQIKAAGHTPIIARIPYSTDSTYGANTERLNAVIDTVTAANSLPPGPDLYTLFKAHTAYLDDGVHPNKDGCTAWQAAWASALAPLL